LDRSSGAIVACACCCLIMYSPKNRVRLTHPNGIPVVTLSCWEAYLVGKTSLTCWKGRTARNQFCIRAKLTVSIDLRQPLHELRMPGNSVKMEPQNCVFLCTWPALVLMAVAVSLLFRVTAGAQTTSWDLRELNPLANFICGLNILVQPVVGTHNVLAVESADAFALPACRRALGRLVQPPVHAEGLCCTCNPLGKVSGEVLSNGVRIAKLL
jgi:hypothetical protein